MVAHKRRLQKELREDRADQELLKRQNREREVAEAAADDYEYQAMLEAVKADSLRMIAMNSKRPEADRFGPSEYRPMEEQEAHQLQDNEKLRRLLNN
jgi:hypothetical protein